MATDLFKYRRFKRRASKFHPVTATVVFIDIVGFTKRGDNQALKGVVRTLQDTINDVLEEIHWDERSATSNEAIMIPTGDGYGIAFEPSLVRDKDVLVYATKLSVRLAAAGTPVRMGINNGPCFVHIDLNDQMNLAGWGIIDAARAMACGTKNHILCTGQFAEPYLQSTADANFHKIGSFSSKGRTLSLYNYYGSDFGNSAKPSGKLL